MGVLFVSGMAEGEKLGLSTAVALLHDPAAPVPGDVQVEQLELLPLTQAGASVSGAENLAPSVRGAGRPVGSKNKNTEAWRDYILSRYQSPLVALAETYSRSAKELSKELGCPVVKAFEIQISAAKELAPYVHQKMPIAVDAGNGGLISLVINNQIAMSQGVPDAGPTALKIINQKDDENQLLNDKDLQQFNAAEFNENPKDFEYQEVSNSEQAD